MALAKFTVWRHLVYTNCTLDIQNLKHLHTFVYMCTLSKEYMKKILSQVYKTRVLEADVEM